MNPSPRILIVDDEAPNRELLQELVTTLGYESETAADGLEALAKLELDIDLVLMDVTMPGMDGFEVARRIRRDSDYSDIPIIMVTALTSRADRLRAVEAGANDFISKPIDTTEVRVRMATLLKMKEAQDVIKRHRAELEKTVERRTVSLRKALEETAEAQRRTHEAHLETIQRLAVAAEYRDEHTAAHIQRMSRYSALLARRFNLPAGEEELILHASPMHDVGKIGIPDAMLLKPGKLTGEEWEVMKEHSIIGSRILSGSSSELLEAGELIALSHHEKWDGSGYPGGLAGEDIPLWGRICAVADVFDALTSERPYKEAFSNEKALMIMKEGRGKHFDAKLLDLLAEHMDEMVAIQETYRGGPGGGR